VLITPLENSSGFVDARLEDTRVYGHLLLKHTDVLLSLLDLTFELVMFIQSLLIQVYSIFQLLNLRVHILVLALQFYDCTRVRLH